MKNFLILAIALSAWWAVWMRLSKLFMGKGYSRFLSHGCSGVAGFSVALIVLVTLIDKPEQNPVQKAASSNEVQQIASVPEAEVKHVPTLGLTAVTYAKRLNSQLEEAKMLVRVPSNPSVIKGEVNDTVMFDLGEQIKVVAVFTKDSGELMSVNMIASSDGTGANAVEILLSSVCVLRAAVVDTKLNEQVGATIKKLMLKDKGDEASTSETLGNVKLFHSRSKLTGIWFSAEAI